VRRTGANAGLSLIELMVTVAIIGVLASTAIPAFIKYTRKAKSAEARQNVRKMYDGARAYYLEPRYSGVTNMQPMIAEYPHLNFVGSFGPFADPDCCAQPGGFKEKCEPQPVWWENPIFRSLLFAMPDPHYYAYGVMIGQSGLGNGGIDQYWLHARGDLDCDTRFSNFYMYTTVDWSSGQPYGTGLLYRHRETE
jgi:prepilin-type N-terminal cleavage/methylation domain-containing protein